MSKHLGVQLGQAAEHNQKLSLAHNRFTWYFVLSLVFPTNYSRKQRARLWLINPRVWRGWNEMTHKNKDALCISLLDSKFEKNQKEKIAENVLWPWNSRPSSSQMCASDLLSQPFPSGFPLHFSPLRTQMCFQSIGHFECLSQSLPNYFFHDSFFSSLTFQIKCTSP